MNWLAEILRRLHFRIRGSRFDRELAEEMRLHIELRAAARQAEGIASEDAASAARRQFGNATYLQESSREAWGWTFLDRLWQDLRYGIRALIAQPGFTLTAVASLALGIGANTAIFSIINAVILRSLPIEDPQALVQVKLGAGADDELNTPLWEQIRDKQQAFAGVLAYSAETLNLGDTGEKRRVQGVWVSGDFFQVLKVPAMMGREFTRADEQWGGGPDGAVAVISHDFWRSYFGGDSDVVGKTIRLNRHNFVVVGVTPAWFRGLDVDRGYDVAIPLGCQPILRAGAKQSDELFHWWLRILGRMEPGGSVQLAQERMQAIAPEILHETLPPGQNAQNQAAYLKGTFSLRPAGLGFSPTRVQYRTALIAIMAIVGVVLLIACANIANLLLARGTARQKELSVRMAIGASRARVIRQLMTESTLLAALGAAGGFLFALWGSRMLLRLISTTRNPLDIDIGPDFRLLGFTSLVALFTALLFGLIPSLRSTRAGLTHALKENDRGTPAGNGRTHFGRVLVVAQVALSMILLVGAGLFLETFRNLLAVDPGFDRQNVLLMSADLPEGISAQQRAQAYREILSHVRSVPGVAAAAHSVLTPISPEGWAQPVYPEGFTAKSPRETLVFFNQVSTDYFRTMRTPLVMGREFSDRDTLTSPKVMLVNEATARAFFGTGNPIGKNIGMDKPGRRGERESYQVIGVVKDTKYNRLDEQTRRIGYLAAEQDSHPPASLRFAIRSAAPTDSLVASLHSTVSDVNREILVEFRTLEGQVNESLLRPRLVAVLSSIFGGLALLLAIVGLYGITSHSVARRKGEIGIRIALGAQQGSVVRLILKNVTILLGVGTLLGWTASFLLGRLVTSLLFGLRYDAPAPLAAAAVILGVTAGVAAYLPARRAARLDPIAALREE